MRSPNFTELFLTSVELDAVRNRLRSEEAAMCGSVHDAVDKRVSWDARMAGRRDMSGSTTM